MELEDLTTKHTELLIVLEELQKTSSDKIAFDDSGSVEYDEGGVEEGEESSLAYLSKYHATLNNPASPGKTQSYQLIKDLQEQLVSAKKEIAALSVVAGVNMPEKLQRRESIERTSASLTLQAEADDTLVQRNDILARANENIEIMEEHKERTFELKQSIQEAIATTMGYLKGHLLLLRPSDKAFLNRAIASCAVSVRSGLFFNLGQIHVITDKLIEHRRALNSVYSVKLIYA